MLCDKEQKNYVNCRVGIKLIEKLFSLRVLCRNILERGSSRAKKSLVVGEWVDRDYSIRGCLYCRTVRSNIIRIVVPRRKV